MSTVEERTAALRLLDVPIAIGCGCGCLHELATDTIGRPEVLFRCVHPEHHLDGTTLTYFNPPHNAAVLSPSEVVHYAGEIVGS